MLTTMLYYCEENLAKTFVTNKVICVLLQYHMSLAYSICELILTQTRIICRVPLQDLMRNRQQSNMTSTLFKKIERFYIKGNELTIHL